MKFQTFGVLVGFTHHVLSWLFLFLVFTLQPVWLPSAHGVDNQSFTTRQLKLDEGKIAGKGLDQTLVGWWCT
jgi:hypothetical protein